VGLRNLADLRTLLWTMVLTPGVVAVQYLNPHLIPYLWWVSCYFALACGVIAHNHNHCPTFKTKQQNQLFGMWISIFYGYPTFAWIPTHNLNHHKLVNKAGDATITWRYTNRHIFRVAMSYFFVSSWFQKEPIDEFIRKAKAEKPSLYRQIQAQYAAVIIAHLALLGGAIALHGVKTGIYTWAVVSGLPGFFALFTIMLFNYEQHVHADPWSEYAHSRSFNGALTNFFLFNNGYHFVHHENPGTHWSKLKALHLAVESKIPSALLERSLFWYWFRQYALAPLFPGLGTQQYGRAPFDPPGGAPVALVTDSVGIGEAGTNAARI